ncbi:helix-turn-helix domain-containing protein [Paenibacillus profundus]|uniref:Helix-turn-helix domain-containing protein n=1 Tax=Paenibacillus profundus TaxID=1173085 RepID=A0ABS8YBB0_9BACL|nr:MULTISPECIES: helix-turn-helix domain-containing protein [Paenibacillus]MCE5168252.1 helix-turn-helix domain-containing protein [Paenibacillus profundus]
MEKQALQLHIERILGKKLVPLSVPTEEWHDWTKAQDFERQSSAPVVMHQRNSNWVLLWKSGTSTTELMQVDEHALTEQERQWIELILWMEHQPKPVLPSTHLGDEQQALMLGQWIIERMREGDGSAEVPDTFSWKNKMFTQVVPFLLVAEHAHREGPGYKDLYRLMKSYFGGDLILLPLSEKEWFILCPEQLTQANEADDDEDERETMEELLTSFCLGLYELLANEWVGESHLSIGYPFSPVKGMPGVVAQLRETIYLGRTFHVTDNIHLPWELHLERLVNSISDEVRKQFLQRVVTKADSFTDVETMATLGTFFQYDCSVSETAKRLYIHRNTLLYRLDKIKHETGLDVRKFTDAVLVKLILLLYKVTK